MGTYESKVVVVGLNAAEQRDSGQSCLYRAIRLHLISVFFCGWSRLSPLTTVEKRQERSRSDSGVTYATEDLATPSNSVQGLPDVTP
jgi:hypothetical protein